MPENIICKLCGGRDFYKDAGFYYCSECQTQTREIREQVFDTEPEIPTADAPKRTTKKIKVKSSRAKVEQITSWECYNYILLGLVGELIELGADPQLKPTVKFLWFKYLEKMEVINEMGKPRLQALNCKVDADIIYGRSRKRKRAKKSPSLSPSSGSDTQSQKQARTKAKKAMVMADYEEYSRISSTLDSSLHNQSLQSLKGSADSGSRVQNKYLMYNRPAKKALLRTMTKRHFHRHRKDVDNELNCHKFTYKKADYGYARSAYVLTRNKLYALLYLGLLLNKDKIQLGDMLRFIREGHLSYEHIEHFIPEEKADKKLNMKTFTNDRKLLYSRGLRLMTAKMAVALKVTKFIKLQNLPELSRRYCKELNLPDEIVSCVLRHMSLVKPKMRVSLESYKIPNYEARAISFIIFILKLLLGLDDKTEYYFSNLANSINARNETKMFEFEKWAKHLKYRQVILKEQHFPTQFTTDKGIKNPQLYAQFMTKHFEDIEGKRLKLEFDVLKQLLEKVKIEEPEIVTDMPQFEPTLTPYCDYIKTILKSDLVEKFNYNRELLEDFSNASIDFFFYPSHYLKNLDDRKYRLIQGGANKNSTLIKIREISETLKENSNSYVTLQVVNKKESLPDHIDKDREYKSSNSKMYDGVNTKNLKSNLKDLNKCLKEKYPDEDIEDVFLLNDTARDDSDKGAPEYYNCEAKYWLFTEDLRKISVDDFEALSKMLPSSFNLVLSECARIIEQSELDLYSEFCNFEIYMCYQARYSFRMKRNIEKLSHTNLDPVLKRLFERAVRSW